MTGDGLHSYRRLRFFGRRSLWCPTWLGACCLLLFLGGPAIWWLTNGSAPTSVQLLSCGNFGLCHKSEVHKRFHLGTARQAKSLGVCQS